MSAPQQHGTFETILRINGRLLGAALTGFGAYVLFPVAEDDWNFWLVVILLALVAVKLTGQAVTDGVKLYTRDRAIERYMRKARKPRSAKLADDDDLRRGGLIE